MEPTEQFSSIENPAPIDAPRNKARYQFQHLIADHLTPGVRKLESLANRFSPFERLLFYILGTILIISSLAIVHELGKTLMVSEAAPGGTLVEGIVGTPRFINPLLANSDADRDLASLVYSGLMRATPDGDLIPDLAASYTISDDGTEYTFTLRSNATFQDGKPVTAEDILFTIATAQNPDFKSTKRANWDGVKVEKIDERTVRFTIGKPYAPFLENATLGILPQHLWNEIPADGFPFNQLNTRPVGSGPYQIQSVRSDTTGTPVEYFLKPFSHFTLGEAHISTLDIKLYATEDAQIEAFKTGKISALAGVTANRVASLSIDPKRIVTSALPRVFAIFLNQSQATVFLNNTVRKALDISLDKEAIVNSALAGYGTPLDGPIPPFVTEDGASSAAIGSTAASSTDKITAARKLLTNDGWTMSSTTNFFEKKGQSLSFALSTADTPELVASANAAAAQWRALGVDVSVKVFSSGTINMSVIRPRNYDALLFGEIVGRTLDLFAFWHSSQRSDPGLNLALYTNGKADTLLSEARAEVDRKAREATYASFAKIVQDDHPAVFLYAPDFIYIIPAKLKGVALGALTTPSERFLNVYAWHIETKDVWYIFSQK